MRIAVIGSSGSGKTTLAGKLAQALGVAQIELDQINWQAGWRDLNTHDQPEFIRRVEAAICGEAWALAGNYGSVRDQIWSRATDVVWLDYSKAVVMRRVLWRSFLRAADGKELWPGTGNRETFRMWLDPEHPIRWAWDTYARRKREYGQRMADPKWAHVRKHRLTKPRDAEALVRRLTASPSAGGGRG